MQPELLMQALGVTVAVEVAAWTAMMGLISVRSAWRVLRHRRDQAALGRARRLILSLLDGSEADAAARRLRQMDFRVVVRALAEFRRPLAGVAGKTMGSLADSTGVTAKGCTLCRSRFWGDRLLGLRVLALSEPETRTALVVAMLNDPDPDVRNAAADLAPDHPSTAVISALVERLDEADPEVCLAFLDALSRCGATAAARVVAALNNAPSPEAIINGLTVLRATNHRWAPGLALQWRSHPSHAVRQIVADTLGATADERATSCLHQFLSDPHGSVRQEACRAAGRLRLESLAPDLLESLSDPDWRVRRQAALALRSMGNAGHAVLMQALGHTDQYAADMARHVLDMPETAVGADLRG